MKIVILLLKLVITLIVGQTLYFKFSGAEESVYIFSTLGIEPWGRLALGTLEFFILFYGLCYRLCCRLCFIFVQN